MHPQLLRQLRELAPTLEGSSASRAFLEAVSAVYEKLEGPRAPESLFAAINEGVWDWTIPTGEVYFSPQWIRLLGYEPADVPARVEFFYAIVHPDDVTSVQRTLDDHLAGRMAVKQTEVRLRLKSGAYRWFLDQGKVVARDAAGAPTRMVGTIEDITERKRAEAALRDSEENFRFLFENAPDAIFVHDVDQARIVDYNANVLRLFECTADDMRQHRLGQFAPEFQPDGRRSMDTAEELIARAQAGEILNYEWTYRTAKGRQITCDVRLARLPTSGRRLLRVSATDITERKQAERALRENEEKFRGVFDHSPVIICLITVPDGRTVEVNAAAVAAFGFTHDEARGKTTMELGVWADPQQRAHYLGLLLRDGVVRNLEAVMRRKDGSTFTVLFSTRLVSIGGQRYSLNILQDITARKDAERAREHLLALTKATLESTADGILVVDPHGRIQTYNRTFVAMWRLPEDVVASGNDERAIACVLDQLEDPEKFLEKVRSLYAEPLAESFDTLFFKDGRTFERYSRPQVFEGQSVGRVWSFRDVTARMQGERALTRAHRRASLLAQLGRELSEAAEPQTAAMSILDAAQQMLGWDSCWLRVVDPLDHRWSDLAAFDVVDGKRRAVTRESTLMTQPVPILQRAIDEGAQLVLRDHEEDQPEELRPFGSGRRSLSLMFVPIRLEGRLVGLLSLQSYRRHAYDHEALELTQTLAHHCAGALVRLQTRAALGESEARFRLVWENSTDGMRLTDAQGRIVAVNEAFCRMAGKPQHELVGQLFSELYAAPDRAHVLARHLERFAQRSLPEHMDRRMTLWDGRTLWYQISTCFIQSDSAHPLLLGLFRDVTAQKTAEEALAGAHRQASALAELGRELAEAATSRAAALSIFEGARQLLGWDSAWLRLWNEEKQVFEEAVNFDLIDGERSEVPPNPVSLREPSPAVRRAMSAAYLHLRRDEMDDIEGSGLFGNNRRSLSRMFVPIRRSGRLLGVLSIQSYTANAYDQAALDLLQTLADHCAGALVRIQAHAALSATEERFRLVWERTADGMRLTDLEGRVVAVNDAYCAMVGQPRAAIEGQLFCAPFAAADHQRIVTNYRERVVRRELRTHSEVQANLANGSTIWVEASDCFIETDPAHPLLLGIFRDISARVRAATEHARLEESLRQAQKMESLGTLAGGIAHDFNNILTGMFGFLELARYDLPSQHPAQEWLKQVMDSGQRAKELVRQILTFSRSQPGARAPVQLHRIIGEAVKLLRSTLPAKVELGSRLDGTCPPVLADANQVHQIVMNLCTNAWHALPERDGRIFVALEPTTAPEDVVRTHPHLADVPVVCLTVADNGSGIEPEALPRIFDPFFTTKEVGKGTGLGLAVVHGIVGTHEAAITVQSIVCAGTTFRVYFPALSVSPSPVSNGHAAVATAPAGQGQHILWIDDDVATNLAIERTLSSLGYRVTACRRPADAVEIFTAAPMEFDLVLTDLSMPEMGGDEIVTIFQQLAPSVPLLVVTGFVQPRERDALLAQGAREVLQKPLTRDELATAIARHVPAG